MDGQYGMNESNYVRHFWTDKTDRGAEAKSISLEEMRDGRGEKGAAAEVLSAGPMAGGLGRRRRCGVLSRLWSAIKILENGFCRVFFVRESRILWRLAQDLFLCV